MPQRIRRCTGLRPSRASGSARGRDDRHGVVEEGALHLLLDLDRLDRRPGRRRPRGSIASSFVVVGTIVVVGGRVGDVRQSRNRTSLALVTMNCLRVSTSSPMRIDMTSSARAACSTLTCSRVRQLGVHGRDPQLLGVHLAEALQAGEVLLVVRVGREELGPWRGRPSGRPSGPAPRWSTAAAGRCRRSRRRPAASSAGRRT